MTPLLFGIIIAVVVFFMIGGFSSLKKDQEPSQRDGE